MDNYKKILVIDNEIVASLLATELEKRDIPYLIKSYHDSAYDGLFQFQKGWGHIEAHQSYETEINEIYNDLISDME